VSAFRLATCQFPVSADSERNLGFVVRLVEKSVADGADAVHFPECALSGYPGSDLQTWHGFDWDRLREATEHVMGLARSHSVWIVIGSSHRLSPGHLPHNSVYVIGPDGTLVDRYDKLFCTPQDLDFFSPGGYFSVFEINGVTCGILICHDFRYPEVYRDYYTRGVRCVFQSFYNARKEKATIHTHVVRPSLQARAASNHVWISASNASGYYQSWPSVFVAPDGRIMQSLRQHRAGTMINTVDLSERYVDKCSFRDEAINGILHSGTIVDDPRSVRRDTI
jgi:predicted amidohydrolase